MNLIIEALQWLLAPERFGGSNPITLRLEEHLFYTFISVATAAIIAIPLGFFIGHTGKGRDFAVGFSGAARALPSFGLILFLVLLIGVAEAQLQLAAIIAFVLLAIPSILAGAYAGIEAVDHHITDAARAVGMTEWQILWKVEVPLGLPLLIGGLRASTLQVVATATLAAYVGLGGLGIYIFRGLPLQRYDEMLGSALLIAALALVLDGIFALIQQFAIPRGVSAGRAKDVRTSSPRRRTVAAKVAQERRG
jgi:osmoprotectant transport system permease protein